MLLFRTNDRFELYIQAFAAYSQTPYLGIVNYVFMNIKNMCLKGMIYLNIDLFGFICSLNDGFVSKYKNFYYICFILLY